MCFVYLLHYINKTPHIPHSTMTLKTILFYTDMYVPGKADHCLKYYICYALYFWTFNLVNDVN